MVGESGKAMLILCEKPAMSSRLNGPVGSWTVSFPVTLWFRFMLRVKLRPLSTLSECGHVDNGAES